ncbi:30S ribosomal protein S17 [Patescibacteria group bacterium]|nr:30S ribosomal protein S17 [Patescibacteria group bacterium]
MTGTQSTKPEKSVHVSRRQLIGTVVSSRGQQTVIVEVIHTYQHPVYKKALKKIRRLSVHNPGESLRPGQRVRIEHSRPISKRKHYIVTGVLL